MAKLIDVEEAVSELKKLIVKSDNHTPRLWPGGRSVTALRFIIGWLEKRPVVEAEKVVRCKECKYRDGACDCTHPANVAHYYDGEGNKYDIYTMVEDDHYCSYGDRREG